MKLKPHGKGAARLTSFIGGIILTPEDMAQIRYFLEGLLEALVSPIPDNVQSDKRTENVMSPLRWLGASKIGSKLCILIHKWLHDWTAFQIGNIDQLSLPELEEAVKGNPSVYPNYLNSQAASFQSDEARAAFCRMLLGFNPQTKPVSKFQSLYRPEQLQDSLRVQDDIGTNGAAQPIGERKP